MSVVISYVLRLRHDEKDDFLPVEMKERYPLPSAFLPFFNQAENYIEKKEKDMAAPDL